MIHSSGDSTSYDSYIVVGIVHGTFIHSSGDSTYIHSSGDSTWYDSYIVVEVG
jgi:hypothetical protein